MEGKKKVVFGILEFLAEEFNSAGSSADMKESLEVATQCLETAFGVTAQDAQYKGKKTLRELYESTEGRAEEARVLFPPCCESTSCAEHDHPPGPIPMGCRLSEELMVRIT